MTYFRNKFDKEFLFLCNKQEPKGGSIRLDAPIKDFWVFRQRAGNTQPQTIQVIPLLLYNKIESDNKGDPQNGIQGDINVDDYMMICQNLSETTVTCSYDPYYQTEQSTDYICDFGVKNITGDLTNED